MALGEARKNSKVAETSPAEVVIRPLHVSPIVTLAEDSDVLAVVRLIDELRIGGRHRAQVGNVASHDRRLRPNHRHAGGHAD